MRNIKIVVSLWTLGIIFLMGISVIIIDSQHKPINGPESSEMKSALLDKKLDSIATDIQNSRQTHK